MQTLVVLLNHFLFCTIFAVFGLTAVNLYNACCIPLYSLEVTMIKYTVDSNSEIIVLGQKQNFMKLFCAAVSAMTSNEI